MANMKIIDLPTGSPESTSFVEATQVDELAESGRSTVKLALNALGNYVAGQGASPLEYGDLETESTTLIGCINELHDSTGADAYDDTATYSEGALCIYNNTLYICTVSGGITTPEAWTAAHWTATTIEALIAAKQDNLTTTTPTCGYTISIQSGGINAYKYGKILIVTGWLMPTYDKVANDTIAYVSGERVAAVFFASPNSSNGLNGRLKMTNQNNQIEIVCESVLKSTDYYSFTLVGIVN